MNSESHLPVLWFCVSYLPFLLLGLLICKVGRGHQVSQSCDSQWDDKGFSVCQERIPKNVSFFLRCIGREPSDWSKLPTGTKNLCWGSCIYSWETSRPLGRGRVRTLPSCRSRRQVGSSCLRNRNTGDIKCEAQALRKLFQSQHGSKGTVCEFKVQGLEKVEKFTQPSSYDFLSPLGCG